jgi:predicted Zn-dependent peptidase
MSKETNISIAGSIGTNELYAPGRDLDSEYVKAVKAVTPEKIRDLAKKYFTNPCIYSLVPPAEK